MCTSIHRVLLSYHWCVVYVVCCNQLILNHKSCCCIVFVSDWSYCTCLIVTHLHTIHIQCFRLWDIRCPIAPQHCIPISVFNCIHYSYITFVINWLQWHDVVDQVGLVVVLVLVVWCVNLLTFVCGGVGGGSGNGKSVVSMGAQDRTTQHHEIQI